jgi:hypothetical protein
MNWKLIFLLSLFGLAMAIATVFVVPSSVEPWVWLAIFLICAYAIARAVPSKLFLHGLLLGIANSVWVTAAHIGLFDAYMAHHAREAAMMQAATMPLPPRLMMACVGPIVGAISGVMLGLLAMVAGWMLNRGARPATSG